MEGLRKIGRGEKDNRALFEFRAITHEENGHGFRRGLVDYFRGVAAA